jgi:hypothetical protein
LAPTAEDLLEPGEVLKTNKDDLGPLSPGSKHATHRKRCWSNMPIVVTWVEQYQEAAKTEPD